MLLGWRAVRFRALGVLGSQSVAEINPALYA